MKFFISVMLLVIVNVLIAHPPVKPEMDIYTDYTLQQNMICKSGKYAIQICASDVTLDLGGHVISGSLVKDSFEGIILADNVRNIVIKNGIIDGCNNGIVLGPADHVFIKNITIINLVDVPDSVYVVGINVGRPGTQMADSVIIRKCDFHFRRAMHKDAVMLGGCRAVIVDSIEVHGGGVGVNFGGENASNASVIRSTFKNGFSAALVMHSSKANIWNNKIDSCEVGITTDPNTRGVVSNLTIQNNIIRDCHTGIAFFGVTNSKIIGNDINNKNRPAGCGYRGITLMPNTGCELLHPIHPDSIKLKYIQPDNWTDCFFSKDNLISGNKVAENIYDLYHEPRCVDNKWENNIYKTKKGFQIPAP